MQKIDLDDEILLSVAEDESDVAMARLCRIVRSIREYSASETNPMAEVRYVRKVIGTDIPVGYLKFNEDKNISFFIGDEYNTIIRFDKLGRHVQCVPNRIVNSDYYLESNVLLVNDILPEILEFILDYTA